MAEPQRALFLHSLPDTLPPGITRIYAGAEFCPWRLPPLAVLRSLRHWAKTHACAFTLVTPVQIEPQRSSLTALLAAFLPEFDPVDELVISDWGTLELARQIGSDVPVALGRVLSGQRRDPRTPALDLPAAQREHFRSSSWHSAPATALLLELGIRRVELDNLRQGLAPLPAPLCGTLHVPYAMVASSRNCPFRAPGTATPCPQPCGEEFSLSNPQFPVALLQGGNTQFLHNARLPSDLAACGIDRLVEHLSLPH